MAEIDLDKARAYARSIHDEPTPGGNLARAHLQREEAESRTCAEYSEKLDAIGVPIMGITEKGSLPRFDWLIARYKELLPTDHSWRLTKIRETHPHCNEDLEASLPGRSLPCDVCWMIREIERLHTQRDMQQRHLQNLEHLNRGYAMQINKLQIERDENRAAAAFREGVNARLDKKDRDQNPHLFTGDQVDDEFNNWDNGWEWENERLAAEKVLNEAINRQGD